MRPLIQRPKRITLIATIYALLPFVNLLQLKAQFHTSWLGAVAHYPALGALLMLSAPVVAFGLFRVRRWGYTAFLLHAGALMVYNVVLAWKYPQASYVGSLVRSGVGLLFLLFVLRKEIYSPYLALEPRGFRRKTRTPVAILVNTATGIYRSRDLSAAGMFLLLPQNVSARLGERQDFILKLQNDDLTVSGEIMRRDADGIGVAFRSTRKQRATIKDFLSRHYPSRIPSSLDVLLRWKGTAQRAQLWNLSTEGAYVVTPDGSSLPDVLDMELTKPLGTRARARVRWFNPHGEFGKPPGLGVEFTSVQSRWRLFKYLWTQKRKEGVSR
jgi:hypothetical protein